LKCKANYFTSDHSELLNQRKGRVCRPRGARDEVKARGELRNLADQAALEVKGVDDEQNRAKRSVLAVCIEGADQRGGFGVWEWDVAFEPHQVRDIIALRGAG
jgi:hypothetical protein